MPTVRVEYNPYSDNVNVSLVMILVTKRLPSIVAPQMNIEGRELHNGGVSENEIIVNTIPYSRYDQNVNDIQVTIIAHNYKERLQRVDEITEAIRDEILDIIQCEIGNKHEYMKIAVSVWLIPMGYAII